MKSAGASKSDEGDHIEDDESCLMEDDTTREENKVEMIASTTSKCMPLALIDGKRCKIV